MNRAECRCVYTYRDPREAIASMLVFAAHSLRFESALAVAKASLEFMDYQRHFAEVVLVSYRELTEAPRHAIRKIADHLDLAVDDATIAHVENLTSSQEASAIASKVETASPDEVYRDDKYLYHRRSLIHRNHVTGAGAQWRGALTNAQTAKIHDEMSPWADMFGWLAGTASSDGLLRRD